MAMGLQNISIISNAVDNFAFEEVADKKVIISDDFKYINNNKIESSSNLLNKKVYINKIPVMFIFNKDTNNKMLEDQAFINKLLIYTFTYQILDLNSNIKDILIKELPQIMMYCNKLYLKKEPN